MLNTLSSLRSSYEKNWPEVYAAFTGSIPGFIYQRCPEPIHECVPVFCYHQLEVKSFEADLKFLFDNGYTTIDSQGLVDHLLGTRSAASRSVVLTVDDGMKNLLDVGFPLLRKYGMNAVAFLSPRFHADQFPDFISGDQRPCSWPEIREMHDSGRVDFQSHSYEHRYIPRWPEPIRMIGFNEEQMRSMLGPARSIADDFLLARTTLEENIGKEIRHLAFVKFAGSDEAVRVGRACGYHSFWGGYIPRHHGNHPGQSTARIARLDAIYMRRLPGKFRVPLRTILFHRYRNCFSRHHRNGSTGSGGKAAGEMHEY